MFYHFIISGRQGGRQINECRRERTPADLYALPLTYLIKKSLTSNLFITVPKLAHILMWLQI